MERKRVKREKYEAEKVTAGEKKAVLTEEGKKLLKIFQFSDVNSKTIVTMADLTRAADIIEKLQEIKELTKTKVCKFTPKECNMLISAGHFDDLSFCIRANCVLDRLDSSKYRWLSDVVNELKAKKEQEETSLEV